jgi:hypothetical protein
MTTEVLWVSLEERSRTNSPRQWFHSQLCYQIVSYFCRTLYMGTWYIIQINWPNRCSSFTSLLLDVYVSLNMFRAPPHPSSGAYNCTNSLWFYRWNVLVAALLVVMMHGPANVKLGISSRCR